MISVIIPVYNTAEYLDQCISSVVSQSYRDLEILLIDDGSTDGSAEKLRDWKEKDSRIVLIQKEHNSGVSSSRNIGLQRAKGEFIAFIDSDDWIDVNFYAELHRRITETGADIALGGYQRITEQRTTLRKPDRPDSTVLDIPEALTVCMPRHNDRRSDLYIWDKLFRKSALIESGDLILFENYSICEDVLWFIRVLLNCKTAVCCHSCGYHYRFIRQGNTSLAMSGYHDLKKCEDAVEANQKVLDLLSKLGTQFQNYAQQRVLFYKRYAFRTAANLNNQVAYDKYRTGYSRALINYFFQDHSRMGLQWLARQVFAELRFQLSRFR